MATIRNVFLGSAGALCLLGAASGCELIASVDPDLLNQGGGGGSTTSTTSTTTTTTGSTTSGSTTSSSSGGGQGGQGGTGGTGGQGGTGGTGGQGGGCSGPEQCPDPGECRSPTCEDQTCGEVLENEGAACDNAGDAGFCEADGDCVECINTPQCGEPSNDCRSIACNAGSCEETNLADGTPCDGGLCDGGTCDVLQQCTNGQIDTGETDVDCGGPCPNCENGLDCDVDGDCQSDVCNGGTCAACTLDADCNGDDYCEDAGANDGDCRAPQGVGAACDRPEECTLGFCPEDGVCCDEACNGTCEACGAGSCEPRVAGTDDEDECAAGECLTGTCSGASSCGNADTATTCGPAVMCSNAVVSIQDTCGDNTGTCQDSGSASCGAYECNAGGTACRTTCTDENDCTAGNYCEGTSCVPVKGPGDACVDGVECASTFCTEGVCCNSGCAGSCNSCVVTGLEGTCSPVGDGQPGAPACAGGFLCDATDTCPTACTADGDCVNTFYCDDDTLGGSDVCIDKVASTGACTNNRQCESGTCTALVCD
jgi:hypothetical protein